MRLVKVVAAVLYCAITGLFGLSLIFSDLAPDETVLSRTIVVVAFYVLAGVLYGLFLPLRWKTAGFIAWGSTFLALGIIIGSLTQGIGEFLLSFLFLIPILLALGGGKLGSLLRSYVTHAPQKRVFIVHRWSGRPDTDWYPWLAEELKSRGYSVELPATPHSDEPTIGDSVEHLRSVVGTPNERTYFIGHSIGCQIIIRYLQTIDSRVGGAVFVAPWLNLRNLEDEETEKIAEPWLTSPIDFEKVRRIIRSLTAIFSTTDPYVPTGEEQLFREKLGAKTIALPNAGHFTEDDGFSDFPLVRDEFLALAGRQQPVDINQ